MFEFEIEKDLEKKIIKLYKKDLNLALNFKKKIIEIISRDKTTIQTYKNLKSPMQDYKRVHLTSKFILLFKINLTENKIIFMDILHHNKAYK